MTSSSNPSIGNYLPEQMDIPSKPEDLRELLKNTIEKQNVQINRKDTGQYELSEIQCNQTFFGTTAQTKRYTFRTVINTGALLNAAPTAVNHNLNGGAAVPATWMFTRVYGFARDPITPLWIPLPNGGIHDCSVQVTATQVIITPTVNLVAFTESYVILEYWKGP